MVLARTFCAKDFVASTGIWFRVIFTKDTP